MPRTSTKGTGKSRHDPLLVQLREDDEANKYGRVSKPGRRAKGHAKGASVDEDAPTEDNTTILDTKTSRKIFELARDQQVELGVLDEDAADEEEEVDDDDMKLRPRIATADDDEEEEYEVEEYEIDAEGEFQIDQGDMSALDTLLPSNTTERRTLADLIFAKIDEAETAGEGGNTAFINSSKHDSERGPDPAEGLNPKVVEVYTKVGLLLSKYTSGPLPKPFKIIPSLPAWARILALTRPEAWSPQAAHAATRIFVAQMKPAQARVFLEGVLLDAIREDIRENRNKGNRVLHPHYYEALKRAVYKPGAFFKGIVFPLLETGCSLKEAAIIASVLAKKRLPMLHSSAALMRLAEMEYSGPNSLFIRVLIDKKYALPYKVVDALVFHFIRLSNTYEAKRAGDAEKLPVLWHQSLLAFCQRYASDITPDQKDALLDVVRATPHAQIGPEVRRELVNAVARGEPRPDTDGDVTMG